MKVLFGQLLECAIIISLNGAVRHQGGSVDRFSYNW